MAKRTLLDMVQSILNDMDSDEVNSISDTVEATQVASVIKDTYFAMIDELDLPVNNTLFQLTASGLTTRPTHMVLPDSISKVQWVKYDTRQAAADPIVYADIIYLPPYEFATTLSGRDSTDTNILVVSDPSGIDLFIRTDVAPTYYTSFDDETLIFDAYDSSLESTLQTSKTHCYGSTRPTFTVDDAFIPDLPENLFSLLLNEAKSMCFVSLKQLANAKVEQNAKRMRIRSQRNKWRTTALYNTPNYGRK